MRAVIACLILLSLGLPRLHADAPDRLFTRPWTELEPLVRIEPGPYPIPLDVAEKTLLEQARVLLSGMVYGWSFSYTPGDKARRVEESFVLAPIAQIPWGNLRLRVIETETSGTRLWARVLYSLDDEESRRRASWESNVAALSTGEGTAALQHGAAARGEALEAAVRDAIRRGLDTRYLNKPRQITGELVLWNDPLVVARSGAYTTTATIKLMVRELIPYRVY